MMSATTPIPTTAQVNTHVARRLREARAEAGMSQIELAARVDYAHQVSVSHWEKGTRPISLANLVACAVALEQPLSFFLDFETADPEAVAA